jgi:hypothetical protein
MAQRLAAIAAAPQVSPTVAPPPKPDRDDRREPRQPVFRFARVVLMDRSEVSCVVTDMSPSGARIVVEGAGSLPEMIRLRLVLTGETRRARVAWRNEKSAGLSFLMERTPSFGGNRGK